MNKAAQVDDRYMARVYLAQARVRRHQPAFHAVLLRWAADRRRRAAQRSTPRQPDLFQ